LGTMYGQQGKFAEAIDALKHALEINVTDADAHYALGTVYQNENDYKDAAIEFKEAIRYIPDFVEAYQGLATNDTALGNSAEAQYASAMVQLLQGNPAAAATQLQDLIKQSPNLKVAYFGLGLADEKLGKRDEAIVALTVYVKANPNDIAAQQALGRVTKGN
jgi:protein O-GlcNAc transferase